MDDESIKMEAQGDSNSESQGGSAPSPALQECQVQLEQYKNKYLYLNAEFDNYKKRLDKERGTWIEHAQDVVLLDILPIIDDMERALSERALGEGAVAQLETSNLTPEIKAHIAGMDLISKEFMKMLKKYQVEEIPAAKVFDPEYFEAVMQVNSEAHTAGDIVSILQKGYMRRGRILRPAKVSVAA